MEFYSTNGQAPVADLRKAVVKGLAEDKGLYMPQTIKTLPKVFFDEIQNHTFQDIAYNVASAFFGEDVDGDDLQDIVYDTLSFDCPVVKVTDHIYSLELFHGPTLAFKDVGARFMARLLGYFLKGPKDSKEVNVLVATSGDTGSAVANGFLGVDGIHVYVLYPKGKVSPIQECQFTTLGKNITAIEVDGVFDDCQALVKNAFMDKELNDHMKLTSANSINVARFLPQAFYYFYAYAQMKKISNGKPLVFCVPSGNFGNICAGLFAKRMGLPVQRFIAANNANSVFYEDADLGTNNLIGKKVNEAVGEEENALALYTGEMLRLDGILAGDDEIDHDGWVNFVGTGDDSDIVRIDAVAGTKLSLKVTATDAVSLVVYGLQKNGTLKALKTIKSKNNVAELVNFELKAKSAPGGQFFLGVISTNAKKGSAAYYNVDVVSLSGQNSAPLSASVASSLAMPETASVASALSMPETASVASSLAMPETDSLGFSDALSFGQYDVDVLAGSYLDSASDKLFGETGNGLLA